VEGAQRIMDRLGSEDPDSLRLSAITAFELHYKIGAARVSKAKLRALAGTLKLYKVLPFTAQAAKRAAHVRLDLERVGLPIGRLDVQAAGHALALGYTFVTDNEREFRRVSGLRVENWLR
jgi:tRNA(fMet)-specific endonuclease VapC